MDQLEVLRERETLSKALLGATTTLASGQETDAILKEVCDRLVAASPHIRLIWMIQGNLQADTLRPHYASGPAKEYGYGLIFNKDQAKGPARQAIDLWHPVKGDITQEKIFEGIRPLALQNELRSTVCLPFGDRSAGHAGLFAIYADQADYFEKIGLDLFEAFTHLVGISLEQSILLNKLSFLANYDQLTAIFNRRGLQEIMQGELSRCQRHGRSFSIILFDLDRFKLINDGLGHSKGDIVLQHIAALVRQGLRSEDTIGRWGGEEFLCLLSDTPYDQAQRIAERFRAQIASSPIMLDKTEIHVTASFGYACYPDDGDTLEKLVAAADSALYQAKHTGRNRVVSAQGKYQRVHSTGSVLESALKHNRIVPAVHPIIDLNTGQVVANEVLARLIRPDGQVLDASSFIDAAHRLQLLYRIDYSIIKQALIHQAALQNAGTEPPLLFINMSTDLLRHGELVQEILQLAEQVQPAYGKHNLVLEITERETFTDFDAIRELLDPVVKAGIQLAIDDFGSGYSSYQYLVELPISILKIDGGLVRRIHDPKVEAILRGLQDTASQLNMRTVAEYVENREISDRLRDIGIDWAQGHFYGRPQFLLPAETAESLMDTNPSVNH